MPYSSRRSIFFIPTPLLLLLCACHGGAGSTDKPDVPLSGVDLALTNFTVSPAAADPEDVLTLSGTIQNVGTETANPVLGNSFVIGFNLSGDGTVELNEQGFLQETISDPIPPGESLDFTFTGSYGHGDTLARYGVFCTGDLGTECTPPETGVIGAKADFPDDINEAEEGDNFAFDEIEVVGTAVGSIYGGCDSDGGCTLTVSDGISPQYTEHRPSTIPATQLIFPNELQRYVYVSVAVINCLDAQQMGGTCCGSWTIVATTQKPGLPASTKTLYLPCIANFNTGMTKSCTEAFPIRDPDY